MMNNLAERLMKFADDERSDGTRSPRTTRFALSALTVAGVIAIAAWLIYSGDNPCNELLFDSELAGTSARFAEQASQIDTSGCDLDSLQIALWKDFLFAAVYSIALGLFLATWWTASWDGDDAITRLPGAAFGGVALLALCAEGLQNLLITSGLHADGNGVLQLDWAPLIFTVLWVKWMFLAILVAAACIAMVSWLIRIVGAMATGWRGEDDRDFTPPILDWARDVDGREGAAQPRLAVCLSGGGVRSAAFGLGALSALEETQITEPLPHDTVGLLGAADLLASVSGGGYATSAWRIAAGNSEGGEGTKRALIGDPNRYAPNPKGQATRAPSERAVEHPSARPDLFPHLLKRREFLSNGRGGLVVSIVVLVLQLLWHLLLIVALVGILAWPLGRFIGSWVITAELPDGSESIEYSRLVRPALFMLIPLGAVLVGRSFTYRGKVRSALDMLAMVMIGLAGLLAATLVLLPWMVEWLMPQIDELIPGRTTTQHKSTLATFLGGSIAIASWRLVQAPIKSRAQYLGGILLGLGLLLFGLEVTRQSAHGGQFFSANWTVWAVCVAVYIAVVISANPDLWSMHWWYRRRLGQTFANRLHDGTWVELEPKHQPPMSAYENAPGPKLVICVATGRMTRETTGIPAVSMTFEPDYVTIHLGPAAESEIDEPDSVEGHDRLTGSGSRAIRTSEYEKLFGKRWRARSYSTVMCACALSAAAFAPSLGKQDKGSTNALIAALNLRLGAWMPNPGYARGRRAAPDMFSMYKEMTGRFGVEDPNLYVTDGGHWENLALVELVRRRARVIIAVDASNDKQFSFSALQEAIELARLECDAQIIISEGGLEAMRPGDQPMAEKNWCTATVHYHDGSTGRLLYVKTQSSEDMPLDVLRYAKEDPTFPHYSTGKQFLAEAEFANLSILGRESMIVALRDQHEWLFGEPSIDDHRPIEVAEHAAKREAARAAKSPLAHEAAVPLRASAPHEPSPTRPQPGEPASGVVPDDVAGPSPVRSPARRSDKESKMAKAVPWGWRIKNRLWSRWHVLRFRLAKKRDLVAPKPNGRKIGAIPFEQADSKIPLRNVLVFDKLPKEESSLALRVLVAVGLSLNRRFPPAKPGLPEIDPDIADALGAGYTARYRKKFRAPELPDSYAGSGRPELEDLAVQSPYSIFLDRGADGLLQWDFRMLGDFEHHEGLQSLAVRVVFSEPADGGRLSATRIESGAYGVVARGEPDWQASKTLAICAATTHMSLTRHFNYVHLISGNHWDIATRNYLPPDHALYRLVWPHMRNSLYTNYGITAGQLYPDGDFVNIFSFTHAGLMSYFDAMYERYNITVTDPQADWVHRGLEGADFACPSHQNLVELFTLMHDHAKRFIDAHYETDEHLQNDSDVVAWLAGLADLIPNGIAGLLGDHITRAGLARLIGAYIYEGNTIHDMAGTTLWDYQLWADRNPTRVYTNNSRIPVDVFQRTINNNFGLQLERAPLLDDYGYLCAAGDSKGAALFTQFYRECQALQDRYDQNKAGLWRIEPKNLEISMNG